MTVSVYYHLSAYTSPGDALGGETHASCSVLTTAPPPPDDDDVRTVFGPLLAGIVLLMFKYYLSTGPERGNKRRSPGTQYASVLNLFFGNSRFGIKHRRRCI